MYHVTQAYDPLHPELPWNRDQLCKGSASLVGRFLKTTDDSFAINKAKHLMCCCMLHQKVVELISTKSGKVRTEMRRGRQIWSMSE